MSGPRSEPVVLPPFPPLQWDDGDWTGRVILASWAGVPYEEVVYHAAGINHLAWILKLEAHGRDLSFHDTADRVWSVTSGEDGVVTRWTLSDSGAPTGNVRRFQRCGAETPARSSRYPAGGGTGGRHAFAVGSHHQPLSHASGWAPTPSGRQEPLARVRDSPNEAVAVE